MEGNIQDDNYCQSLDLRKKKLTPCKDDSPLSAKRICVKDEDQQSSDESYDEDEYGDYIEPEVVCIEEDWSLNKNSSDAVEQMSDQSNIKIESPSNLLYRTPHYLERNGVEIQPQIKPELGYTKELLHAALQLNGNFYGYHNANGLQSTGQEIYPKPEVGISLVSVKSKVGTSKGHIWNSKIPSKKDIDATEVFIEIVGGDYVQTQLNNGRQKKKDVFEYVYKMMEKRGFLICPDLKEGGQKCYQKWRNLERSYFAHVKYISEGGTRKAKPPYWDRLDNLLRNKKQPMLPDTKPPTPPPLQPLPLEPLVPPPSTHDNSPSPSSSSHQASPDPVSPGGCNKLEDWTARLINSIREMHDEDRVQQELRFQRMEELLREDNLYKKRIGDLLELLLVKLGTTTKKKYSSESE